MQELREYSEIIVVRPNIMMIDQADTDEDRTGDACDIFPDIPMVPGDINNDGNINLTDIILVMQVMSNIATPVHVFKEADVNNDGYIGLEEALHTLQITTGLKSHP
jgi:hypothetical protein